MKKQICALAKGERTVWRESQFAHWQVRPEEWLKVRMLWDNRQIFCFELDLATGKFLPKNLVSSTRCYCQRLCIGTEGGAISVLWAIINIGVFIQMKTLTLEQGLCPLGSRVPLLHCNTVPQGPDDIHNPKVMSIEG